MVQRQDRVVATTRIVGIVAALTALYSSAALSALGMGRTPEPCPALTNASAWINKMPSINQRRDHAIQVVLEFEMDDRSWTLAMSEGGQDDPSVLVLDLVPGGERLPGSASFRTEAGAGGRSRVAIYCDGRPYTRIENIRAVY